MKYKLVDNSENALYEKFRQFLLQIFFSGEPKFTIQPESAQYTPERTVFFRCTAVGDPDPQIVWLHNQYGIYKSYILILTKWFV